MPPRHRIMTSRRVTPRWVIRPGRYSAGEARRGNATGRCICTPVVTQSGRRSPAPVSHGATPVGRDVTGHLCGAGPAGSPHPSAGVRAELRPSGPCRQARRGALNGPRSRGSAANRPTDRPSVADSAVVWPSWALPRIACDGQGLGMRTPDNEVTQERTS